jgi:hypothetical protein
MKCVFDCYKNVFHTNGPAAARQAMTKATVLLLTSAFQVTFSSPTGRVCNGVANVSSKRAKRRVKLNWKRILQQAVTAQEYL